MINTAYNFKLLLITFLLCILNFILNAQKETNTWVIGMQLADYDTVRDKDHLNYNKYRGGNIINFNNDPFTHLRFKNTLSIAYNNVTMCDSNGELLFYSNGSKVFNKNHHLVKNGDSFNYSLNWVNGVNSGYFADYIIGDAMHSILVIPNPSNKNQFYLIATYLDWGNPSSFDSAISFPKVMYSKIDMSLNNGLGEIIVKEEKLINGKFCQGVYGCKKSNGKDWWVFVRDWDSSGCFNKITIDSLGIRVEKEKECIGYNLLEQESTEWYTTGNFSHNGNHFSFLSHKGLELMDFDRCKGEFSNLRKQDYPYNDTNYTHKLDAELSNPIFSPNSQYLYVIYTNRIYQYDVKAKNFANSKIRVATYDGKLDQYEPDTNLVAWPAYFFSSALAPDGKIYIGTHQDTRFLHVIENPDEKGLECNVIQHKHKLTTFMRGGVPYYPNYSLGVSQEQCCKIEINKKVFTDGIGLMVNDTGSYQWLNCDSNLSPIFQETKNYFKPKTTGFYTCMIKNSHCEDTVGCYHIKVEGSGLKENHFYSLRLYPNPASDKIFITELNKLIHYTIYNLIGQEIKKGFTKSEIDVNQLSNGIYYIHLTNDKLSKSFQFEVRK